MRSIVTVAVLALALYGAMVAFFYLKQGALLYPASSEWRSAAAAGLAGFADVTLTTSDGERIVGWFKAPKLGKTALLYFHGNGGSLMDRRDRAQMLTAEGRGLLIVSYRGYSGSTGTPTEGGLQIDARSAYDWLAERVPAEGIVLYGESLGSGVAVRLASERKVAGLILDAPFTSAADVAGHHYWYLPIWLLRDQYRSIDRIHEVKAPLLVMHGDRDGVIPIALGKRLFEAAPEPKHFLELPGVDHVSVLEEGGLEPVRAFLTDVERHTP